MTDDLVRRLRALREAANPGTWMQIVADNAELLAQMEEDAGKVDDRVAGLIYTREGGAHGKGVTLTTINARRSTIERDQANALLIVEAVNALPTLLARIEALEAENRRLREVAAPFVDVGPQKGAWGVISKKLTDMAPLTVTVTKGQFKALFAALTTEADHAD